MSFVADSKQLRTYDPERGYELLKDGGGSSGELRFRITGPQGTTKFSASFSQDSLSDAELRKLGTDDNKTSLVWTIHNSSDEWKGIIREAMMTYMFVHGTSLQGRETFVRFGSLGSVFDN